MLNEKDTLVTELRSECDVIRNSSPRKQDSHNLPSWQACLINKAKVVRITKKNQQTCDQSPNQYGYRFKEPNSQI